MAEARTGVRSDFEEDLESLVRQLGDGVREPGGLRLARRQRSSRRPRGSWSRQDTPPRLRRCRRRRPGPGSIPHDSHSAASATSSVNCMARSAAESPTRDEGSSAISSAAGDHPRSTPQDGVAPFDRGPEGGLAVERRAADAPPEAAGIGEDEDDSGAATRRPSPLHDAPVRARPAGSSPGPRRPRPGSRRRAPAGDRDARDGRRPCRPRRGGRAPRGAVGQEVAERARRRGPGGRPGIAPRAGSRHLPRSRPAASRDGA